MTAPIVLGVSSHFHDSAAALVQGDRILAAAQEERFTRRKGDWRFPENAIGFCLSRLPAGATLDRVAYFEDPVLKVRRMVETAASVAPSGARLWPRLIETLAELSDELPGRLAALAGAEKVAFVPHHRSHAASAFYPSPFEAAAVLVVDGVGEGASTTIWDGTAEGLVPVGEVRFPHSLGLFYSAFTQFCGFRVNSGEYKLMGLAPFGAPILADRLRDEVIELRADGGFALNLSYFDHHRGPSTMSRKLETMFAQPPRRPEDPITPFHMNVAASVQAVLEEAVLGLARAALRRTGRADLCLAGGVALNCVANARLRREVRNLWVQPAAGDAGGALGAALEVARQDGAPRRPQRPDGMRHALLGPAYGADACRAALEAEDLVFERIEDDACADRLATLLAEGGIVGHFDGPMEFGPRALGNRSILADPRGKDTLNHVNRSIKFREGWRPFAPIVLADEASALFEGETDDPYMLHVAKLRPAWRGKGDIAAARATGAQHPGALKSLVESRFNAAIHVDYSARLQTIRRDDARRVAAILAAFHRKTGCPMLLNTSFNVRGEPIVCTPADAVNAFLNTRLDALALGPYLVLRAAQRVGIDARVGKDRFAED
ncbi:carbamoyltransferase family protein [Jannaschia formosa]|uniref:carbamoyltransferase family protein n=1 Tax=Jannaschia formosa TaxID=2259592 RepID=UPI000E1B58B0|nr:carbamoyltransferase N-terminal domain-containing protein [Jannaschia formosa]TFL16830.1 nodulation protein [Jannaschia formosa]